MILYTITETIQADKKHERFKAVRRVQLPAMHTDYYISHYHQPLKFYIMYEMTKYIYRIMQSGGNVSVLQSWGAHKFVPTDNGLKFEVQGFQFTGTVEVSYSAGSDLFDISLDGETKAEGVYVDCLVSTLDSLIEKGDMTDSEYKAAVERKYGKAVCECLRGTTVYII